MILVIDHLLLIQYVSCRCEGQSTIDRRDSPYLKHLFCLLAMKKLQIVINYILILKSRPI